MDAERLKRHQNSADTATFICMISLGILVFLYANEPSGMEGLWLIFPTILVGFTHLGLGVKAITAAISTGKFARNSWIYGYFLALVLVGFGMMGLYGHLYSGVRMSIERFQFDQEVRLFEAIERDDDISALLASGADAGRCFVWDREHAKHSALQFSVKLGRSGTARLLLDAGVDPDQQCRSSRGEVSLPPLLQAAKSLDTEIVRMLLTGGASVRSTQSGQTALGMTVTGSNASLPYAHPANSLFEVDRNLEQVHVITDLLINAGADVNAVQNETVPLHWAVLYGDTRLVDLLVAAGADVNFADRLNRTPLVLSITYRRPEVTRQLLNIGSVAREGKPGLMALIAAAEYGGRTSIDLLLANGLNISSLNHIMMPGNYDRRDPDLANELARALEAGDDDLFGALLLAGADINQPNSHKLGRVLVGMFADRPPLFQKLIDAGANVNAVNQSGSTSLHYYAGCKRCADPVSALKALLAHGADINMPDSRGQTPLHRAEIYKVRDTRELLLASGASLVPSEPAP